MRIGIPREVKPNEGRVALIPAACAELVGHGHRVFVQAGAGELAGFADDEYRAAGARTVDGADDLYAAAGTIVKVKEPQPEEYARLREDHLLFCFLHLAATPTLARALLQTGLTAVAFESVEEGGRFPILAPMSLIAGRLAAHYGAHLLLGPEGGKGILLGGAPAAFRGRVVVLGAGVAGSNAAAVATTLGAEVRVFDRDMSKLESVRGLGPNVTALYPYPADLREAVATADLLVGAVLVPGARAPHVVTAELVKTMERGSVIIDISVDQGGCIETTRPTTYSSPTFAWEGVVHFGVANMPGAVPRSASQTLSAALSPYVVALGDPDWRHHHEPLARGINVSKGRLVHPALATLEI
ncbi:MAG: alanine dehydrogenase [Gammaproteobacteria bacterium]|nr:alanine dehydrogenase [Gammaproteobacteria bacterium]